MNQAQLEREIAKINRKVDILLNAVPKKQKTWIPASVVSELTGWGYRKLAQRREQGLIRYEIEIEEKGDKKVRHFKYLLESINEKFLIKNQSNENIHATSASAEKLSNHS